MIFNLTLTFFQQNILIVCFVCVLLFLIYQLMFEYYKYRHVHSDYQLLLGGEEKPDIITRNKLLKYWNTSSYNNYFKYTVSSMETCKNKKIIFTGLCQDHGKKILTQWLPFLTKIKVYFKDYRVIIVENDSKDKTRELLLKEAEKDEKFIVLCDDLKPENTHTCQLGLRSIENNRDKETNLKQRIKILSKFRQVYWNYILKNYSDFDYMCVLDWDLEGRLSIPGFFHGLYYVGNYSDVIACNSFYKGQKNMYFIYDTYPLLNHYRCDYLQENKSFEDSRVKKQMHNKILYGSAYPIPVESAFGGMALYNIQTIQHKNASYLTPLCPIECEHTTFHQNLNVHIDPWMTFYITKNNH